MTKDQSASFQNQSSLNLSSLLSWSGLGQAKDRRTAQEMVFSPLMRADSGMPSVRTNKGDYAPGEVATFIAAGFSLGATVRFSLADDPKRPGVDGKADRYGLRNGAVTTTWRVPNGPGTPSSLGATVNLTA